MKSKGFCEGLITFKPKLTLYISGPMTGIDQYNYPAFDEADSIIASLGHTPINPASFDGEDLDRPWSYYLKRDIIKMFESNINGLVLLDGFEKSRGVAVEVFIARIVLNVPIYRIKNGRLKLVNSDTILWKLSLVKDLIFRIK